MESGGMMTGDERVAEGAWGPTRRSLLLTTFSLLIAPRLPGIAATEDRPMEQSEQRVDKPNRNAPAELSRFAFLIGRWRFDAKFKSASGDWQAFHGTWSGHYILDGYAIADEYRMFGPSGELLVLGMNYRVYDSAKRVWNIKWLSALDGTWTDLTTEQFGGVRFDGPSVTYVFK